MDRYVEQTTKVTHFCRFCSDAGLCFLWLMPCVGNYVVTRQHRMLNSTLPTIKCRKFHSRIFSVTDLGPCRDASVGAGRLSSPGGIFGQSPGGGLKASSETGNKCACRLRKYAYMNTKYAKCRSIFEQFQFTIYCQSTKIADDDGVTCTHSCHCPPFGTLNTWHVSR